MFVKSVEFVAFLRCSMTWLLLFMLPGCGAAQEHQSRIKRLILKDGSYESISQCLIRDDRVRYFSLERNEWEEIPYSLVDWTATEELAGQAVSRASENPSEVLDRDARKRRDEEEDSPSVAPGIRLQSPDGVYLLDVYQGNYELNPLFQNSVVLNVNSAGIPGLLHPTAGPGQTVEIKGLHARIRSHVLSPSIYFPVDSGDPLAAAKDRFLIVRCGEKTGNRIVIEIGIGVYGKTQRRADYVEVKTEWISDCWVRIAPSTALEPGEYALLEFDHNGEMNPFVWDFGVDTNAPANPASVRSNPGRNEPVLIRKPRKTRR